MSGNLGTLVVKLALELKEYRSKLQEAARDTQQAMGEAGRATEGLDTHTKNLGQSAASTAKQLGEMGRAAAQGDLGAVAQQAGQLATQATAASAGVGALTATVGVAVVALAGYAVIAQKVSEEQARQANVMALTGNAAGLLTGQMNEMARSVADSTRSAVGSSREIVESLASTGRVGRVALEDMAAAVELVAQATGKSRDTVVGDFEGMADGVAKWAAKHNQSYHFITYEQYQYIKALEEAGRAQEAMQVTSEALRRHLEGVPDNLGILQRAWRAVGNAASWAWDRMLDLGRAQTTADKLTTVANQVAYAREKLQNAQDKGFSAGVIEKARQELEVALQNQSVLQERERLERRSADAQAASAKATQDKIAADEQWNRTAQTTRSSQQRLADALAEIEKNGRMLGKSDQEIRDMQDQVRASMETRTASTKKLSEAEREAIELRNVLNKVNAKDAGVDASFYKDLDTLYTGYTRGKLSVEEYRSAVEKLINSQQFAREAAKAEQKATEDAQKAREKAVAALIKERETYIGGLEKSAQAVETQVDRLADEEKAATLAASSNISLAKAIQLVAIARLEEKKRESMGSDDEAVAAIQREIDARRELLTLIGTKEGREANQKAADEAAKYWDQTWQQVSQSLTDELMRGGKSGKEYIEGIFRTMVLRPGLQWGIQSGMNALGLGGSGGGNVLSTASNVATLGSSAAGFANGLSAWGAGGSVTGVLSNPGLYSAAELAGAVAPIALGVFAVASLLKGLDDSGTLHAGGLAQYSAKGGLQTSTTHGAYGMGFGGVEYSDSTTSTVSGVAKDIVSILDGTAKAFGLQVGYSAATAFADDTSKDGAWGGLRIALGDNELVNWDSTRTSRWAPKEFADGEEGSAQYAAAIAASTRDALTAMDLPGWADSVLQALGDSPTLDQLGTAVQEINATQAALKTMGDAMPWLASMSHETATSLLQLSGGIATFASAHQAYYDAMYSDSERMAFSRSQMTDALTEQGLTMPASIAAWRELTQAQDRNTESGREAYLTLVQLGPTFKAQMDYMLEQAGISGDSMASVIRDGILGRLSGEDAGGQVADMIVGGIYNAMANSASAMITDLLMQGIVQPMVQAAATGAVVSSSVSQAAIDTTIAQAKVALTAIGAVLNDPAVQAAIKDIGTQTSGLFAGYKAPTLPTYTPSAGSSSASSQASVAAASAAEKAWDKAYSALERAVDAQRQAAEEQLQAATAIYDLARSNAQDLRGETAAGAQSSAAAGREFISSALTALQTTGYLPDQQALGDAINAARAGLDSKAYTSAYEYNRDRLVLAGQLQQLANLAEPQKTAAEQQLDYLDGVLDTAKAQLDKLEGIDNSVLSVGSAIQAWLKAIPASARAVASMPSLPAFDVGTDYVPTDMLALIHQGEQIVPKAYNPHANGQGGRTEALLQALVAEVRSLHTRLAVLERNTERAATALDDSVRGRRPLKTEVVTP